MKYTNRSDEDKKKIQARLHKIEGQVRGISKMIEEDRYCNDVLIQLSSVDKSIRSLANLILENHMYTCISKGLEEKDEEVVDEIISLFRRFQ